MLSRRGFITSAGAACPLCRLAVAAEAPHWTYGEADHWADVSPDYRLCGIGAEQSPIDLAHPTPAVLGDVSIEWRPGAATVINNGHTMQVKPAPGNAVKIGGTNYDLTQFHFHHPAEHTVEGVGRAMEAHFVHVAKDGNAAALAVFLVPVEENPTLGRVFAKMPKTEGEALLDGDLDPSGLLPLTRACYRYAGSLTTPPCGRRCSGRFSSSRWRFQRRRSTLLPRSTQ